MHRNTTNLSFRQGSLMLLIGISSLISGCGIFEDSEKPTPVDVAKSSANTSDVAVKPLTNPKALTDVSLELTLPTTPVESLVLHFGSSPDTLTNIKKISLNELILVDSTTRLYRYTLKEVGQIKPLYIRIATQVGGLTSKESEIFEVKE